MGARVVSLILILLTIGCSNYQKLLDKIPAVGFEEATYNRNVLGQSATLSVFNAKKEGNVIVIENLRFTESYPLFFNLDIHVKGYRRVISEEDVKLLIESSSKDTK